MTLVGRLFALFPPLWALLTFGSLGWALWERDVWLGLAAFGSAYLLPVLAFRLLVAVRPIPTGFTAIDEPKFSPWWAAHNLQLGYDVFPVFENAIRLVPGLYSAWLRLWGSRIGPGVYWTQSVRVMDRSLVDVDAGAIFGHQIDLIAHAIFPRQKKLMLYVERIHVGAGTLIGAYSALGPGLDIGERSLVGNNCKLGVKVYPAGTRVQANTYEAGDWRERL